MGRDEDTGGMEARVGRARRDLGEKVQGRRDARRSPVMGGSNTDNNWEN